MKTPYITLFLLNSSLLFFMVSSQQYNALFNFGDSLSDTGNVVISDLPYGMTYFGRATGRCSDGRLIIDFIAQGLGLPLLPPNSARGQSFKQGANFAIIASPALPFEFYSERGLAEFLWVNASVQEQVNRFEKQLPFICGSPQDCKEFLSKSLIVFGEFGGNDYNTGLFGGWSIEQVSNFTEPVTKAIAQGVERMIGLGAKDIIVPGVLPTGCFPLYLAQYSTGNPEEYGKKTGCMKRYNILSWYHNNQLRRHIKILSEKYPTVLIRYADIYSQIIDFAINPLKYGFTYGALRTCCGAPGRGNYNFNLQRKCDQKGHTVCEDPKTHVSWDGIHMTEAAHGFIADGWLHGPYVNPPILNSD